MHFTHDSWIERRNSIVINTPIGSGNPESRIRMELRTTPVRGQSAGKRHDATLLDEHAKVKPSAE